MHRHIEKQVHAHSHQLLLVQSCDFRLSTANIRGATGNLLYLEQVPLYIWRIVLCSQRNRSGNIGKCHCADNYGVHNRAIRGHMSSVPFAHHVETFPGHPVHICHLAGGHRFRRPPGVTVRRNQSVRGGPVCGEANNYSAFFRAIDVSIFLRSDDADYGAVRSDWPEIAIFHVDATRRDAAEAE